MSSDGRSAGEVRSETPLEARAKMASGGGKRPIRMHWLLRANPMSEVRFSLQLAGKIVHRVIEVDPKVVLDQVAEALELVAGSAAVELAVNPEDRALLEYTEKLTRDPAAMGQEDVDRLRAAGFDDRAIHDATQVVSYFNYINRIADALGTDPEPEFPTHGGRPR